MAHYANQKTIIIHRINPIGEKKQYLAIDCQALSTAARTLTPSGLKLFLYLASNQDGYQKDYSPKDFSNIYGVSVDAARKARLDLQANGYLVENENGKLEFYEQPREKLQFAIAPEKRKFEMDDGSFACLTYSEFMGIDGISDYSPEQLTNIWNSGEVVNNE